MFRIRKDIFGLKLKIDGVTHCIDVLSTKNCSVHMIALCRAGLNQKNLGDANDHLINMVTITKEKRCQK